MVDPRRSAVDVCVRVGRVGWLRRGRRRRRTSLARLPRCDRRRIAPAPPWQVDVLAERSGVRCDGGLDLLAGDATVPRSVRRRLQRRRRLSPLRPDRLLERARRLRGDRRSDRSRGRRVRARSRASDRVGGLARAADCDDVLHVQQGCVDRFRPRFGRDARAQRSTPPPARRSWRIRAGARAGCPARFAVVRAHARLRRARSCITRRPPPRGRVGAARRRAAGGGRHLRPLGWPHRGRSVRPAGDRGGPRRRRDRRPGRGLLCVRLALDLGSARLRLVRLCSDQRHRPERASLLALEQRAHRALARGARRLRGAPGRRLGRRKLRPVVARSSHRARTSSRTRTTSICRRWPRAESSGQRCSRCFSAFRSSLPFALDAIRWSLLRAGRTSPSSRMRSVDWDWQMPAVTLLALFAGAVPRGCRAAPRSSAAAGRCAAGSGWRVRRSSPVAFVGLIGNLALARSQSAVLDGRLQKASTAAEKSASLGSLVGDGAAAARGEHACWSESEARD